MGISWVFSSSLFKTQMRPAPRNSQGWMNGFHLFLPPTPPPETHLSESHKQKKVLFKEFDSLHAAMQPKRRAYTQEARQNFPATQRATPPIIPPIHAIYFHQVIAKKPSHHILMSPARH